MKISINKKSVQIAAAAIFGLSVVGILVSAAAYLATHTGKKKKKKAPKSFGGWLLKLHFKVIL